MRSFRHSLQDILQNRHLNAANGEPLYSDGEAYTVVVNGKFYRG